MALHSLLKELLVCPQCRGEIEERDNGLLCASCGLLFPIDKQGDFPVMLVEEATKVVNKENDGATA